jgi:hypothetical protein
MANTSSTFANPIRSVLVSAAASTTFTLTGTVSTSSNATTTFTASVDSAPAGSTAAPVISDPAAADLNYTYDDATTTTLTANPATLAGGAITGAGGGTLTFTPDKVGNYVIKLVGDGTGTNTASYFYVSASADATSAAKLFTCSVASNTSTCTQSVGNRVVLNTKALVESTLGNGDNDSLEVNNASAVEYFQDTTYYISVTGAAKLESISDAATDADIAFGGFDGATDADGFATMTIEADVSDGDIVAGSEGSLTILGTSAGTATVTIFHYDSTTGVKTTDESVDVNFVTAASVGISSTTSVFATYDTDGTSTCDNSQASPALNAALAADVKTVADTASVKADLGICFAAYDGNGTLMESSVTSYVTVNNGTLGAAGTFTRTVADNGVYAGVIRGDGLYSGPATVSVTAIDAAGNTVTKTLSISFYGVLATVAAVNVQGAGAYGNTTYNGTTTATAFTDYDADNQAVIAAALSAKDAGGNAIKLSDADNSVTTANLAVISSAVPGTTLTRGSISTNGAVVTVAAGTVSGTYGISVDCSASASAEKLTIRAYGLNTTPTPDVYVASNDITYYCSDATSTVTVTPSATSAAAGTTLTAQIKALDKNGFPVPDNTAVTLVAANGAGVSTPSTTTNTGALATAANVLIGSTGPVTVSATVGGKSASAVIAVTGGSADIATQIDALNAKIVALNALIAKIMKKLGVK